MKNEVYMAAIKWGEEPNTKRGISIKIAPCFNTKEIWCYDYNIQMGVLVTAIDDIPTDEELKELKIKQNKLYGEK